MLQTHIKVAIRSLKRKKSFAVINAAGLSVAFSCCLVLFFYSLQELRYDHEWKGNEQVFRVAKLRVNAQESRWQAFSQVPMGPALERDFSEVEASVRFWRSGADIGYNNQYFAEDDFYFTDPKVFEVFGFGLKQGDPASALAAPGSLVISEASAVKYFGDDDPIGKVIEYEGYPAGQTQLTVTGIFYDLPNNSSFQFDFLASLNGMERERNNWGSHKPIWTYLKLKSGADKAHLEAALPKYFDSFSPESFTKTEAVLLQPISEIYTGHTIEGGFKTPHNSLFSYMFMAVGILIFLIATVNFINLSVARLIGRSGEIGIRKVLGAGKSALLVQLLVESIIVVLISTLLAIILIELSLPFLEGLLGAPFSISMANPMVWLGLAGAATVFIALSSIYPSWLVLHLKTTSALKSKLPESKGAILKQSLVVFQFATSLLLVFATLVGYLQMAYIQQKDLGFEKDQLLVVPHTPNDEVFMAQALQLTAVQGVSVSQRVPVNNYNYDSRTLKREGSELPITIESFIVDENFMEVFGMEVLAGEEAPLALKGDTATAIVNEALVKQLGFETNQAAIGQKVLWSGEVPLTIRTVIKNYHTASLHEAIAPTLLLGRPQENWWKSFITLRLRTSDLSSSSAEIESLWRRHTPKGVYQSFFIEDSLAEIHMEDKRMSRLAAVFSGVAIVLSCLGLIGLCSYLLINRRKEFGIRKVLGAGLANITSLVSYTYLKLIAIGAVIALPVGWYTMQKWLDTFAYRITLRPSFLFLTVLAAGGIAFITVFLLSYNAVRENPVKAIREE